MPMMDESRENGSDGYFANAYCRFVCLNFGMLSILLGILLGITWAVVRWCHHQPLSVTETAYFKMAAACLVVAFGLCVVVGGLCHLWLVRHPRLYNERSRGRPDRLPDAGNDDRRVAGTPPTLSGHAP